MRVFCVNTSYPEYVRRFYAERPELLGRPYQEQKDALDRDAFSWTDKWSNALQPLGYDVIEVNANIRPLQRAWAIENGIRPGKDPKHLTVLESQILKAKPDVLFFTDHAMVDKGWLLDLRAKCSSVRTTLAWCGAPFSDLDLFGAFDAVLSCVPELVEKFATLGHRAIHLNHGFDRRIVDRIADSPLEEIDISFIGQVCRKAGFHLQREQLLKSLVTQVPIQIFSPSAETSNRDVIKFGVRALAFETFRIAKALGIPPNFFTRIPKVGKLAESDSPPLHPVDASLRKFMKPPVFGLQMFRTLRRSKMTLNTHLDISSHSASNMRLFEATGVGTCLVTDWKTNLDKLFKPDEEVVSYRSPEECIEKMRWLLDNPSERKAIALAGQKRCHEDHSFAKRAIQFDAIIHSLVHKARTRQS